MVINQMITKNKSKKGLLFVLIGLILIVLTVNSILAADGSYCFLKLTRGDRIPITSSEYYTCKHTICQVCTNPDGWYAGWTKCTNMCSGTGGPKPQPLYLEANFPFSDNGVYTKQNFFMDIFTNKIASINLYDNTLGRNNNLCPNCMEYRKSMTFKQGFNDITIRAEVGTEFKEKRIRFYIDNRLPRITKTLPVQKKFTDGNFTMYYEEDNVKTTELHYGTEAQTVASITCPSGKKQSCSTKVDVSMYEGKEISYYFTITDIANNVVSSRPVKVLVDKTAPVINSFNYNVIKTNVNFSIDITDVNLDKVVYVDNGELRSKILCSSMRSNICSKKVSFRKGHHVVDVTVLDKAGNSASRTIEFDTA